MAVLEGPPLRPEDGVGALTLGGFLAEVCARHREREALVLGAQRWTYGRLWEEAQGVACALLATGSARHARVGILMGNRPEAIAALFGAAMVGAVVVPLSTFAPAPELAFYLRDSGIDVVLTQDQMRGRRYADDVRSLHGEAPYLRKVVAVGEDWTHFLQQGVSADRERVARRAEEIRPTDEGLVIYSSGTTSQPKGVLHTHRAPAMQFWLQARVFGRHEGTRLWTSLPLFWTAGLNTAMGATLAAGGTWVMQEWFEPGEALRLMESERVTEPYCLPHQTATLEEHPGWAGADLSSLTCVYGKSAFARHATVSGDTGWNMPVAYGLSETCTGFATHRSDTPREHLKASSGRLIPESRLRVVDPDTGAELGEGEVGELTIAGPTVMIGYVGVDRADCFDEHGYFHTGDVGYFDAEGYVHWTGRRTEMIKTGGTSVSPAEIEVALRAFAPLKLARVLGVPDPRLGQRVVLCAVLKDGAEATAEELTDFLRARLAGYKVPKQVVFFEDGEIPMTASATKVRDDELLRLVEARLPHGGAT